MKKFIAILFAALISLTVVGCSGAEDSQITKPRINESTPE